MSKREYATINVKEINFDYDNPRHSSLSETWAEHSGNQKLIAGWLEGSGADELEKSIVEFEGCSNPIHVRKSETNLTCFDGNTRLSIYKKLLEKAEHENNSAGIKLWSKIPAFVYENISDDDVDQIRLHFHLNGTKDWSKFHQTKELFRMKNLKHSDGTDRYSDADLSIHSGLSNPVLNRRIDAYQMMIHYFKPLIPNNKSLGEYEKKFSFFDEFSRSNIRRFCAEEGIDKETFAQWVFEGRLSDSRHVSKLKDIYKKEIAKKKFFASTPEKASKKAVDALGLTEAQMSEFDKLDLQDVMTRLIDKIDDGIIYDELVAYKDDGLIDIENLSKCLVKLKRDLENIPD